MCSKRDIVVFLAGAEAFHTLSHVVLSFSRVLPIEICSITLTSQLNLFAIVINGLATAGLVWWACKLKK